MVKFYKRKAFVFWLGLQFSTMPGVAQVPAGIMEPSFFTVSVQVPPIVRQFAAVISGARGDQISREVRPGLQKSRQRKRPTPDCAD